MRKSENNYANTSLQNEKERLAALHSYQILDTMPEKDFDALAQLTAYICKVPIAIVSLMDDERMWFKATIGTDLKEVNKSHTVFCTHLSQVDEVYEIENALEHELFAQNELVTKGNVRFYAGTPLTTPEGHIIGALCVLDTVPRKLDEEQKRALKLLANEVITNLELRKQKQLLEEKRENLNKALRKRRITKALSENEKRHRKLSKLAFEGIIIHDEGKIIESNAAFAKMFGYPVSQVVGMDISNFLQKEFCDVISNQTDTENTAIEVIAEKKDGSQLVAEVISKPIPLEGRTVMATAIRDITDRRTLENSLHHAQQFLNAVLESVGLLIISTNTDGLIKAFNKGAERILGYSAKELVGKHTPIKLHDKEEIKEKAKLLSTELNREISPDFSVFTEKAKMGLVDENEWTYISKSGERKTISLNVIALKGAKNEIIGYLGIGTDVTDRRIAEKELLKSREYLTNIINAVPTPIFVKDREHRWILLNDVCCDYIGFTREEVLGKNNYELISKEVADQFYQMDEAFFVNRENVSTEEVYVNKDNVSRTVIANRTLHTNEHGEDFLIGVVTDITDRKKVEVELAKNEKRYRALFENSSDITTIFYPDGRMKYQSPSFYRIFGYTKEEVIGKYTSDFIHPDDVGNVVKQFYEAMKTPGATYNVEFRFMKKSGEWVMIEAVGKNAMEDESVAGIITNSRDITDRKKTEVELINSEKRFRSLLENSSDITSILEADGTIRYESPTFYRITGYKQEEVIGKKVSDFVHPDDVSKIVKNFYEAAKNPGSIYTDNFRFKKANGEYILVESISKNALDDESINGFVINSRDITDRNKVESEIKEKSQMLNGILQNMPVIVFKLDPQRIFDLSIGAGLKALGLTDNEVVGQRFEDLYPENIEAVIEVQSGKPVSIDVEFVVNNNPVSLECYMFPDTTRAGGVLGFILDITDKKEATEKLKEYSANLEKVNKELDQFAYIVSHDLKAPLRAIANLSQWIEEDLGDAIADNEDAKENLNLLRGRVNRMQALISGILEYSKAGRTEIIYEKVNVDETVSELTQIIGVPETFAVIKDPLPTIMANRVRLEQIFSNLLSNAIKYHHDKANGKITVGYKEVGNFHEFSVADNGPGIAPEYHDKIFIIFQTLEAKDKVESTGVGLAIVKKIIEEQGGTIRLESSIGEGAKFIFTLPKKY